MSVDQQQIDWGKFGTFMVEADVMLSRGLVACVKNENYPRWDDLIYIACLMFKEYLQNFSAESGDTPSDVLKMMKTATHHSAIFAEIMAAAMSDNTK